MTSTFLPHLHAHLPEDEEREFQINRANFAAARVITISNSKASRESRGGRGGRGGRGRGGRGGRGGGRGGRRESKRKDQSTDEKTPGDGQAGEKRKRGVEPDGGLYAGTRGTVVPIVRSTSKKAKTDEGDS